MPIGPDALFDHNPPADPALLLQLFVGREYELAQLKKSIPGSLTRRIRAIHGASRVGKSHLALRFLQDLTDLQLFVVNAASAEAARVLLLDLYDQVRTSIWELAERVEGEQGREDGSSSILQAVDPATKRPLPSDSREEGVSSLQFLHQALQLINEVDNLVSGKHSSEEHSTADADEQALGTTLNLGAPPATLGLSGGSKQTHGTGVKLVRTRPDELGLTRIIRELCEHLQVTTGKRVVIYIDDVDLLERRPSSVKVSPEEVAILTRCLHRLAHSDDITVVTSLRTRHLHIGDKEFSEAVEVEPLSDDELKQVYRNHVAALNKGSAVMDEECLDEVTLHAAGTIGNFLKLCHDFHVWGERRRKGKCLTVTDLEDYFQHRVHRLMAVTDNRAYIEQIKEALKTKLEVELSPGVLDTEIIYTLLEEPLGPTVPKLFSISRLGARTLKMLYPDLAAPVAGPVE